MKPGEQELQKNFTYGELWPSSHSLAGKRKPRELIAPEELTYKRMFIDFLYAHGYRVYLDYDNERPAYTDVERKHIVLNGNYPRRLLEDLFQHELGHLILFNVNQFISVRQDSMRSLIAKVLYTAEHLREHGIAKLLRVENIIQDIVIETVSENECVCEGSFVLLGERMGVKHLDKLEDITTIAREVCDALLETPSEQREEMSEQLRNLIDSMLQDLREDEQEILKQLQQAKDSHEELNRLKRRREGKIYDQKRLMDKLAERLERTDDAAHRERLEQLIQKSQEQIDELDSKENHRKDEAAAAAEKKKNIDGLEEKLQRNRELQELLELEKTRPLEHESVDNELHANRTDHLSNDVENQLSNTHSYDCGFPLPVTLTRNEAYGNSVSSLKHVRHRLPRKTIKINLDEGSDIPNQTTKVPRNQLTYFKSAKKEFTMADMLKGKRRERRGGINVLVGLDVSGSMSREWTQLYGEISELVINLQERLQIENIYYFTYNQRLRTFSKEFGELTLKANGGNAFGYVYPQIMETIPLMTKNEIILVTDCGDNLGFPLNDVCSVYREDELVHNHISIIDTEHAGFYDRSNMDKQDWSLFSKDDRELYAKLEKNITTLIDQ